VKRRYILFLLSLSCFSCSEKNQVNEKIADLQDRRATDSLVMYLSDDKYGKEAELAFASVQDTAAIPYLSNLDDAEAMFALGQMYDAKAEAPLLAHLNGGEAYESLGKVISKKNLYVFSKQATDTAILQGIAWGIYRAGVRGVSDSTTVGRAIEILQNKDAGHYARLGVAHFFSRAQYQQDPRVAEALKAVADDKDVEVRMAVVNALAKVKPEMAIDVITKATDDPDYRVRVNAARALRSQPWNIAKTVFEKLLNDENAHVNITAAEVITSGDTTSLHMWAKAAKNWRAQATLFETYLRLSQSNGDEVHDLLINSPNNYQKAALIAALGQVESDPNVLFTQYDAAEVKVMKSAAANAINQMNHRQKDQAQKFLLIYQKIIADGDQGGIIAACSALRDTTLGFKKIITDLSFLEQAKSKLQLPRDYETYIPLERALNYLKGLPPPAPVENKYNHPIDWTLAKTIAKNQHVVIETSKGRIVMKLFIEEAPGSVVNFVKLVNDKYFDGQYFHRVVPNFVIQTGCYRGDGLGSEDYSIRSEFSQRRYKTGSVGMASAGKDTEGTQWFITHSPTPHLDGKYTIFAEVVSGMDVVHQIEVGDKIIEARLVYGE
jgi:cyclophilin family peptidyl-prolyl cis-trans isomerase/HEAT repeat protein